MAQFNELLDRGWFPSIAQRRLGMRGMSPLSTMAPELMPVLDLERRPEYWRLGGGRLAWGFEVQAADAVTLSQVQLLNPADSGALIIVEEAIVINQAPTAKTVQLTLRAAALTTNNSNRTHRDTRAIGGGAAPSQTGIVGQVRNAAAVAANDAAGIFLRVAGEQTLVYPVDVILAPGRGLVWLNAAINLELAAGFTWRERPVVDGELV